MIFGMSKIAIQGVAGSFHDQAATTLVPEASIVECVTFKDVFDAVTSGQTEYGVVAVENSLHGSINPVYRLLDTNNLWVMGETTINVEQFLIGCQATTVPELNRVEAEVRTMFPAFAQCELWLSEQLPLAQRIELYDTAFSVQSVVDEKNPLCVAIAGKYAAEVYGGTIIAGPINDNANNHTRFVLLTKEKQPAKAANRTLLIMTTGHTEGSLYHALGAFADAGINLSKLDSHPIASDTRRYAFYIDIEVGVDTQEAQTALKKLTELGCEVKVLGSYQVA